MVALHHACKTAALADADDVDKALAFENIDQHALANFQAIGRVVLGGFFDFNRNLADELHRREIVLGQVAAHRLGQLRFSFTNSTRPICAAS